MSTILFDCDRYFKMEPDFLRQRIEKGYVFIHQRHFGGPLLNGRQPDIESVQLRTNDYLSIAGDARIANAEINILQKHGHGEAISRIYMNNRFDQHRALEKRIARLMRAEDAVLCMSGYCANTGLLQ